MRSGFNPTRRNRNIGTRAQGHGSNNRMAIPSIAHCERSYWEQLRKYEIVRAAIADQEVVFIIDEASPGFAHACSVEDVTKLFTLIPPSDWAGIGAVYFRQPTRKEELIAPIWGRLAMTARFGPVGFPDVYHGPAIVLPAQKPEGTFSWRRSLDPEAQRELERLASDGHRIVEGRRDYSFQMSLASIRATQLYRTLPHEIGHWVDWFERVVQPSNTRPGDYEALSGSYWARPSREREDFAHAYATKLQFRLRAAQVFPFEPIEV